MTVESVSGRPVSRRGVLTAAVGAGAAVAVAGATASGLAGRATADVGEIGNVVGSVVVHLRDVSSGSLDVFSGSDRIQVKDRALARLIARAATSVPSTSL